MRSEKTNYMLNHLTLHVYNKEIATNIENHQAQKFDFLLMPSILGAFVYLAISILNAWWTKSGPWIAAVNIGCIFPLMLCFRIFRHYKRNDTRFHEYVVISVFAVSVICCILSNENLLPDSLGGSGLDEYRSSYDG